MGHTSLRSSIRRHITFPQAAAQRDMARDGVLEFGAVQLQELLFTGEPIAFRVEDFEVARALVVIAQPRGFRKAALGAGYL